MGGDGYVYSSKSKNAQSGGAGDRLNTWKSEDAYSKVPSPPRQMIKSTRLEMSSRSKRYEDNNSFKSLI